MSYTISDKDRAPIGLIEDGEPHWFSIEDKDGRVKRFVRPPEDGRYLVQVQVRGWVLERGGSDIEVGIIRGPYDADDGGTAWTKIDVKGYASGDVWFDTFHAIVDINPVGSGYSDAIGVDYIVKGGRLHRKHIVIKFEKLGD